MSPELSSLVDQLWTWEFKDPGPHPDVTIVICAYGKVDITLQCMAALIEAQDVNLARAEVILVDDASPDNTLDLVSQIRGLKVLALEQNQGFLRAANVGVAAARGRHVLFLNNDTEPVGQWLDPLLETLERRPNALCVGSRLVYPDGVLQEAGGVIFSDGSGWNYGRHWNAFDPRVTFERQVDYVSGAALLVDGGFLRSRGGFDDRYAPAYYEDTDTCFAARRAGGEVWYQPTSIVVHHEGQSHGTDETSGIKAHQSINRERFRNRWARELGSQAPAGSASVPVARQRSARGRVIVFDNEVPTPDRDSGSVRITAVMESLIALGHAVTFIPLNGWRREPYTRRLERLGVEVLGAPDAWWEHLAEMSAGVSHVWISRPHVAEAVLERVRFVLPRAAVLYDTVDLHFLRVEREALTAGDPDIGREALRLQLRELEVIDSAEVAIVVSPFEQQMLAGRTKSSVCLVPNIHHVDDEVVSPLGRSGILFVGSFQHGPNEDAVEWFAHGVMPLVNRVHPAAVLTIVGSNVTRRVEELASESVVVAGWVPDLAGHYASTRLAVAPLRFGAGVKGKVGEALSLGVPMVMTPMAAEGMHIQHLEHGLIADNAEEMAAHVCRLLSDDELWLKLSAQGRRLVRDRFGVDAARGLVETAVAEASRIKGAAWAS